MIVDLLVGALLDLFSLILSAIPDASLPASASTALEDFAVQIGGALGGFDSFLPITELSIFIGWVLGTFVPIAISFQIAFWVWAHLPVIGSGS